jgi:mannose-1-phosphate guanylyltransferase
MSAHKVRQAFVLGAGLGRRLRPLTDDLPKPLVPIFQKSLITFALDHLIDIGVERFVINTHRLPESFQTLFGKNGYARDSITLIHEPELLETGGGIKNVESYLGGEPFITYSGDILTDVRLQPLIDEHFHRGNDVTLALRKTGLAADVAFRDHRVVDLAGRYGVAGDYDFANIAVWNQQIFQRIPPRRKISFVPIIADWIGQGGRIGGLVMNDGMWFNIGSRAGYLKVHRELLSKSDPQIALAVGSPSHRSGYGAEAKPPLPVSGSNFPNYPVNDPEWRSPIHKSAIVDPSAQLRGCTVIGRDCRVGAEAILEDTILWPGAEIASKSHLDGCIVRSQRRVSGSHRNLDI